MMSEWKTVQLGELCDVSAGGTPSRARPEYFGGDIPWVKIGDMLQDPVISTAETISHAALDNSAAKLLPPGTVLISIFATIGRTAVLGVVAATNQAIAGVTPRDPSKVTPEYLRRFLDSVVTTLEGRARGVAQVNINSGILRALPIPLPPLAEQRRIAEVLDRAEALRAKRRAALAQLEILATASFKDLFMRGLDGPAVDVSSQRSGVPPGWAWELLTDVARLATGHTPDRERAEYWNGDIPWISLTDIRDLDTTVSSRTMQNVTALGIDNSSSVLLPAGTVCFSRTASVGFVTVMGGEMATSQDFVNWVCGPRLNPSYLMWALIDSRPRLTKSAQLRLNPQDDLRSGC